MGRTVPALCRESRSRFKQSITADTEEEKVKERRQRKKKAYWIRTHIDRRPPTIKLDVINVRAQRGHAYDDDAYPLDQSERKAIDDCEFGNEPFRTKLSDALDQELKVNLSALFLEATVFVKVPLPPRAQEASDLQRTAMPA
ncbi:hypothetical protein EYF80_006555 [Liparis tanakae]|uniref:Uncharacterized protein n=1 Tax=Liparis tanakae TaxID=230148 RepID=A0A4Z2J114_9TELE|nr:hypothetical protein EYF80_006555 [Liparis tanakae]